MHITPIQMEQLAHVECLFTDIDDTLSTKGKLTPEAFSALWKLHDANVRVVVVTGRAAGWCDHIARFWPVDAVIGENGGFYFHHDGVKLHKRFLHDNQQRRDFRQKLDAIAEEIFREVPEAGIASDQPYREYDLGIDFCEDVPPLNPDRVVLIRDVFRRMGAHAKISSIHVNGWFGDFDKLTTARLWASERLGVDLDACRETFAFAGDSPNDEPMFAFFTLSFGVANVKPFLETMESHPTLITTKEHGAGFCEIVDLILHAKSSFRCSIT